MICRNRLEGNKIRSSIYCLRGRNPLRASLEKGPRIPVSKAHPGRETKDSIFQDDMQKLSKQLVSNNTFSLPHGPLEESPVRVLQFGEGNFLRAFADWMIDMINEKNGFNGRIAVVQPVRQGLIDRLNAQEGLYTLLVRGIQDGKMIEDARVITALSQGINPYDSWKEVVKLASKESLRFIISNTTEAGIAYVAETYDGSKSPESFPAKVTALLLERFRALGGARAPGLVFLPCELIEKNGTRLKEFILRHAAAWNAGADFEAWVSSANYFLDTLVDRIVPGYPAAEEQTLREKLGYEDQLMVAGEVFHLWVIEGPQELAEEIPFHKAGLNVVWTSDLAPYRTRKVLVLNGAHTANVLGAFLGGLNTVGEMMNDKDFGAAVQKSIFAEILPGLPMSEEEKRGYAEAVMERFRNPFIRHELLSISLNSVSKWKVRVLPSLLAYQQTQGKLPALLTYSLAALIRFYDGEPVSDTELRGTRDGIPYPIRDDASVLAAFTAAWKKYHQSPDAAALVSSLLSQTSLWGGDLTQIDGLSDAVTATLEKILGQGARATLSSL